MKSKKIDPVVTQSFLKKELKRFATKDDLKGFATKDDLKGFATKDDLKFLATKAFVDLAIDDLEEKIEKQMIQLRCDLMEKMDEVLNISEDHEQRITRLEATTTTVTA